MKRSFHDLPGRFGVAGVAAHESERARRWGGRLEVLVSLATLWLPFAWYAEAKGVLDVQTLRILDLTVWGVFLLEAVLLSLLVRDRRLYWRQNWLNLCIVLGGVPLLLIQQASALAFLRVLRLVLLVVLVLRFTRRSLRMLARHALVATLVIALFLVVSIGTLVASIDPNMKSLWDGMWWALATVSTVGYGDVVPASPEGRLLGVVLILFGVATFSMVTANLAAFVLSLRFEETVADVEREEVRHELLILQRLETLEARFDRLEALLAAKTRTEDVEEGAAVSRGDAPSGGPTPP
ncbi:MAG: potassium channel family protein [Halothiobacillaceae bacterium]